MAIDINSILTGIYTGSNTVEMADTLLLPIDQFTRLSNTRIGDTPMNALSWVQQYNTYTAITEPAAHHPRGARAGDGGSGCARRAWWRIATIRQILKLHLPMPHKFLGVMQVTPLRYDVPGIFRTGGLGDQAAGRDPLSRRHLSANSKGNAFIFILIKEHSYG